MPNLRLGTLNAVDAAALSLESTNELAPFPLANIRKTARDAVFRSESLATQVIRGTWNGDGFVPGVFAMFRHNGHGGSVRLQLFSDAAWTTQVYDSGTLAIAGVAAIDGFTWGIDPLGISGSDPLVLESPFYLYFSPVACASFRLTLSGSGGGGRNYWQLGRCWLGAYLEATYNPAFGAGNTWENNRDGDRMLGGTLRSNIGARWRKFDFDLQWITEAQRPAFLDLLARCSEGRDLFLSMFPGAGGRTERDWTMNGMLRGTDPLQYARVGLHSKKFTVEEL